MEQARESSDEWSRDQPPVGGHRGRGQARDGVNLVRLVSLVGWVCSSSAQREAKNSAATLTVDSLDTPSSAPMKSWLVVARSASAPLRLVGHLGWVHQHEARPVGEPRERMGGRRERRQRAEISLSSHENHKAPKGGVEPRYPRPSVLTCTLRSVFPAFQLTSFFSEPWPRSTPSTPGLDTSTPGLSFFFPFFALHVSRFLTSGSWLLPLLVVKAPCAPVPCQCRARGTWSTWSAMRCYEVL